MKKKAFAAGILAATVSASAIVPVMASAAGTRTKEEAFGDSTYAERFMSLYDDVITNGEENGYLSSTNDGGSNSFGIPYHAAETLIVEAPDYGHETTSEAMSYIVWMAAMRDALAESGVVDGATNTNDLVKAWNTMEVMVPTVQTNLWSQSQLSAQYAPEYQDPTQYPASQDSSNTGKNPLFDTFKSAYSSDNGYYLLNWIADVNDWYGYGGSTPGKEDGKFTFINTFQRGEQESCWETVPHPCVEELKYGNADGIKGIFNGPGVAKQYAYTNAPDAEDRAIQAVYAANLWGVGDSEVSALAGKMGDQCRNNMFDKYYKAIGCQDVNTDRNGGSGLKGQHFLMAWYTSWGGALDGTWAWQIGASHMHEFYQNPLAAYGLLYDKDMNAGMKSSGATSDYEESFKRQMEMYLWLQSANGPIAGGCTNSLNGRYEKYSTVDFGNSTFYDMVYQEHPVYADPGSNHWIGNQVWAVQRLAELYYYVMENGDQYGGKIGGLSLQEALESILDRWVEWFVMNTELTDDGDYAIPATLDWFGEPAKWTGTYNASANDNLTCEITNYGNADLGSVSSLADTLIYYAAAKGVVSDDAYNANADTVAGQGLYLARELMDRQWEIARDDIGLSRVEHNQSLVDRFFDQEVWIPNSYSGTMPNGDKLSTGATFYSIRSMYDQDPMYDALLDVYNTSKDAEDLDLYYHRFWHAGDIMMAMGAMAMLYPDVTPVTDEEDVPSEATLWGDANCDGLVDIADVIAIMDYANNSDKNALTAQGIKNADVHENGNGLNSNDALTIQQYLAGTVKDLPL